LKVWGHTLKSLIDFEFIFVYGESQGSSHLFFFKLILYLTTLMNVLIRSKSVLVESLGSSNYTIRLSANMDTAYIEMIVIFVFDSIYVLH
jgi:hypothetical protein